MYVPSDYEANPELDRYSPTGLDDDVSAGDLSFADRRAAEREVRRCVQYVCHVV
jgi:hypothetical protein